MNLNDARLPKIDSATGRGLKAGLWAIIGTSVTLATALWLAIDGVPGCSETVLNFMRDNFVEIAGAVGVSSGVTGFLGNAFNKNVKNY